MLRSLLAALVLAAGPALFADTPKATGKPEKIGMPSPDLTGYSTVDQAIKAVVKKTSTTGTGQPGYLGVSAANDAQGRLVVEEVDADGPAAKAGLQVGDVLLTVSGDRAATPDQLRALIQGHAADEVVKLSIMRGGKPLILPATVAATSRPMSLNAQPLGLGLRLDLKDDGGVIASLSDNSPAAKAGLKTGELIVKVNGQPVITNSAVRDALSGKRVGDSVPVTVRRENKDVDVSVAVVADDGGGRFARGGNGGNLGIGNWDSRVGNYWKRADYKLAIIGIEYPDVKHNDKVSAKDWEESLFSRDKYNQKTSVTGQSVYGSMNDYYHELSCGTFHVSGKMFDWVEVSKKKMEYAAASTGPGRTAILSEALDKVLKRDGKDALKDFDGVFFLYAGDRPPGTNRGGIYWPHRANLVHDNKRWPYFICPDGGARMANISVFCHEFGHMLGLPDLYARPENPGSEGLGVWCAMSNQVGNGRPQHFSAWCKEMLSWLKPTTILPTDKQKLILSPVENSPKECYKVLVRLDGSEYFLLENRRRKGFDTSLPAEGLLIWRVVGNHPILEESHGIEGPAGPGAFATKVPFPSTSNRSFTPYTTPSSRSQLGGGLPVHITNIRQLADGRITFHIGYDYQ